MIHNYFYYRLSIYYSTFYISFNLRYIIQASIYYSSFHILSYYIEMTAETYSSGTTPSQDEVILSQLSDMTLSQDEVGPSTPIAGPSNAPETSGGNQERQEREATERERRRDARSRSRREESDERANARREQDRNRHSRRGQHERMPLFRAGFNYDSQREDLINHPLIVIGSMDVQCSYCQALTFHNEPKGLCCDKGTTHCSIFEPPPNPWRELYSASNPQSNHFIDNIRRYNGCFQMTSFGADKTSDGELQDGFQSTFIIQGQVHHRLGSLCCGPGQQASFLQIYSMDFDSEDEQAMINRRLDLMPGTRAPIIRSFQELLERNNS